MNICFLCLSHCVKKIKSFVLVLVSLRSEQNGDNPNSMLRNDTKVLQWFKSWCWCGGWGMREQHPCLPATRVQEEGNGHCSVIMPTEYPHEPWPLQQRPKKKKRVFVSALDSLKNKPALCCVALPCFALPWVVLWFAVLCGVALCFALPCIATRKCTVPFWQKSLYTYGTLTNVNM